MAAYGHQTSMMKLNDMTENKGCMNAQEIKNMYASIYRDWTCSNPSAIGRFKRTVIPFLDRCKNDGLIIQTVLDAGCACGGMVREFIALGYEATGTSFIADNMKHLHRGINVINVSYQELDSIGSESYDLVTSMDVLEHLYDERDAEEALLNLYRISKKALLVAIGLKRYVRHPMNEILNGLNDWIDLMKRSIGRRGECLELYKRNGVNKHCVYCWFK